MKLFIGYGYNARDQWIEDWVFPLVRSLDFEVESGKPIEGEHLRDAVRARVETPRAAICFFEQHYRDGSTNTD